MAYLGVRERYDLREQSLEQHAKTWRNAAVEERSESWRVLAQEEECVGVTLFCQGPGETDSLMCQSINTTKSTPSATQPSTFT